MFWKSLREPLFYRYLLSYVLVFGLPIVIIGLTMYANTVSLLKKNDLEANWRLLQQVSESVDTEFREIMQISGKLMYNRELLETDAYDTVQNMKNRAQLNFAISSEFIEELVVYTYKNETLISNESSYTLDLFKKLYSFEGWASDEVGNRLQSLTKPQLMMIRRVSEVRSQQLNYLAYMVPLPINADEPKAIAIFLIKETALSDILTSAISNEGGNVFITDKQGRVLTSQYPLGSVEAYARELLQDADRNTEASFKYDRTHYQMFRITSSTNGYQYVAIIPQEEMMKSVNEIRNRGLLALALILVIGSVIIFGLMHFNFNPLQELIHLAELKWGNSSTPVKGIGKIRHAMQQAERIHTDMKEMLDKSIPALRQQMLGDLLRGRYENLAVFNERGSELGIELHAAPIQVAVIEMAEANEDTMKKLADLEQMADELQIDKLYKVNLIDQHRLAVIIQRNEEIHPVEESFWQSFHAHLSMLLGQAPTIGVGSRSDAFDQVAMSFLEASSSLNYASVKGRGIVILFKHIQQLEHNSSQWQPSLDFEALRKMLLCGKFAEARNAVADIIRKISETSNTMFRATSLCFEVMNFVGRVLQEVPGFKQQLIYFPDMITLSQIHTIKELREKVYQVCDDAFKQLEGVISDDLDEEIFRSVIRYLQEKATSQDYSVQNMADDLSLSLTQMRKVFKERTGTTISDYVNEIRLNKAKELLIETNDPVQEIVRRIGYSDVSSFIRKFKQETRMTPGEYRKAEIVRRN